LAEFTGWDLATLGAMTEPELNDWFEEFVKINEERKP
jgi:hypothetical protein